MSRDSAEPLSSLQFLLLLHSVPQVGEKALARLLRLNAQSRLSPDTCLSLSAEEWRRRYDLDARAALFLSEHQEELLARSAELARTVRTHRLHLLTLESASYPARLERFDAAPPPVLYALGRLALLEERGGAAERRFTFTIAASNGLSQEMLNRQDGIASTLIEAGGVPVTGHDRAPYKRLALAAQRRNRPILYVLDRGLREAMGPEFDRPPFAAARIREAVFEPERDLAISPFRLDDHGLGANNRRRDRLICALSDVVIALDVRAGGGMAGECHRAWEQGRPVFVAEGGRGGNDALRALGCPPLTADHDWAGLV